MLGNKNYKFTNKEKFIVGEALAFLAFETFIRTNNYYRYTPIVDIPSHILGGAMIFNFLKLINVKHPYVWLNIIASIGWEIGEVTVEQFYNEPLWQQDNNLSDSIGDILCNNIGAIASDYILRNMKG